MRRSLFVLLLLAFALAVPAAALASLLPPRSQQVTGTLTSTSTYSLIVQTAGRPSGVLAALTTAADRITAADYPYVWGGGHGQAGVASVGERRPGTNGKRRGYDCSGSVAAVLAGAGLWPAGYGVPNDAGVIRYLRQRGEIVPGAGEGVGSVTLYDDPGVHIFMNIDGRFFGTSAGAGAGDPAGGAGWLGTYAPDAKAPYYQRWHLLSRFLKGSTKAGHDVTFELDANSSFAGVLAKGETVRVSYQESQDGTMTASGVAYANTTTATGTVTSVAPDASSFPLARTGGGSLTIASGTETGVVKSLAVGQPVSVTYTRTKAGLVAVSLSVTGPPPPAP